MKIIKAFVEQITPPIDGMEFLKSIELASRIYYKPKEKITDELALALITKLVKNGHESIIEHTPRISMKFTCDRNVSHEIMQRRLFSVAQESTHYDYDNNEIIFILPYWFKEDSKNYLLTHKYTFDSDVYIIDDSDASYTSAEAQWVESMLSTEIVYWNLVGLGWLPQHARSVLPNSLKTELIVTGNIREWQCFFKLRTNISSHSQTQEVANMALELLKSQIPVIFNDI